MVRRDDEAAVARDVRLRPCYRRCRTAARTARAAAASAPRGQWSTTTSGTSNVVGVAAVLFAALLRLVRLLLGRLVAAHSPSARPAWRHRRRSRSRSNQYCRRRARLTPAASSATPSSVYINESKPELFHARRAHRPCRAAYWRRSAMQRRASNRRRCAAVFRVSSARFLSRSSLLHLLDDQLALDLARRRLGQLDVGQVHDLDPLVEAAASRTRS